LSYRLGENLDREWAEDANADELWDAVNILDASPSIGKNQLEQLAQRGSAVAMMHLGDALIYGRCGIAANLKEGENWLLRSAEGGSVEGRFRLANFYVRQKRDREALSHWIKLADWGYSPAIFYLGYCHYHGLLGLEVNLEQAIRHWRLAHQSGHFHAGIWLAQTYETDRSGLLKRIAGFWIRLKLFIPFVWYWLRYPTSDRLRLPWRSKKLDERLDEYEAEH